MDVGRMRGATAPLILALVLVTSATPVFGEAESCPLPFVSIGGLCYYINQETWTWSEARLRCQEMAPPGNVADLAIVDTCEAHGKLWHYILRNHESKYYFIGGSDIGEEGFWYWLDGQPIAMGVPSWRPDDPNGATRSNCLAFYHDGFFCDEHCDSHFASICQLGVQTLRED